MYQQTNQFINVKQVKKMQTEPKKVEKVTRDALKQMQNGETIQTDCRDGYDLESQKNTAYAFQKLAGCKFTCRATGLQLTVTRNDTDAAGD